MLVPTDVTNPGITGALNAPALGGSGGPPGVTTLHTFNTHIGGPIGGIVYHALAATDYTHPNPYTLNLKQGQLMASIRKPSQLMLISTPYGDIAVTSDGDVLVRFDNGVLRVMNLNSHGGHVEISLYIGPFAGPGDPMYQLAVGYELVAADRKLTRADLRPPDAIGRRGSRVFENGRVATSQFSLESVLDNSELISEMKQSAAGTKEQRILTDLSKMAAVLNVVNNNPYFESTAKPKQP